MFSFFSRSGGTVEKSEDLLTDTVLAPGASSGESVFGNDAPLPEALGNTSDSSLEEKKQQQLKQLAARRRANDEANERRLTAASLANKDDDEIPSTSSSTSTSSLSSTKASERFEGEGGDGEISPERLPEGLLPPLPSSSLPDEPPTPPPISNLSAAVAGASVDRKKLLRGTSTDVIVRIGNGDVDTMAPGSSATEEELLPSYASRRRKHAEEGPHEEKWRNHKKHVFIISSAGKPIYTRYGDENELSGFMAIFSAFVFHAEASSDVPRSIIAGDLKIVFLIRGPLYFVMVASTHEPIGQMMTELSLIHAQITSILTAGYNKMFERRPQFDLRPLLGGAEKFLDTLICTMDNDISMLMNAVHCLRISGAVRNTVGNIMHQAKTPDLLFSILLAKDQLVSVVRPKRHLLQPADLHLIVNFVTASTSFKSSESWTPICLPQFNDKGYLHSYVYYITADICLLLISSKAEHFYELSKKKNFIVQELSTSGALTAISTALERQHYSPGEVGVSGLLHFVYKQQSTHQLTRPAFEPPYQTKIERKRLFRLYQHIHHRANPLQGSHKVYYFTGRSETVLAWITAGFQLYAVFGPLQTKPGAIRACNQLLQWIKEEESSLFILYSPTYS